MLHPALRRELGLRDLVLLNFAAVAGIRWLAAAAHAGPGSITLWLLAALFFFVPSALAVAGLSSKYPDEGGLYVWTRESFGDWHAFLCGWCYWLNNLFFLPSLLMAGVGMAAYAMGPGYSHLAENRWYVIPTALLVLWAAFFANVVGMKTGKWASNLGGAATYAAGGLLILAGAAAFLRQGSATPLDIRPEWNWEKMNFWSQIAFAFGGLELGAVLGGEIRDPGRTIRRAAWISGLSASGFYIVGTLAVLVLLPAEGISILTGLVQAGESAAQSFGAGWLSPLFALLVTAGIAGQVCAWLGGCARLPLVIGMDRHLPVSFARLHPRWQTPHVSLVAQGVACTVFLVVSQLGETVRAGYQILVDMAVITYFIPFLYIFLAAYRFGQRASGACGALVTAAAILLSLVPPAGVASPWLFELKLLGGTAVLILAGRMGFRRWRTPAPAA